MKKIKFYPWQDYGITDIATPAPASRFIPKWFASMPRYTDSSRKPKMSENGGVNLTVKACNPFLDSIVSGYTIPLAADVLVEKNNNNSLDFRWRSELSMVSGHSPAQASLSQIPEGYEEEPFKWTNHWSIELPPGYSALFVHPLNRTDLPFYTFSGIVDLDNYTLPVNLPFLIKKDFEGIIPAGTPIAQIIPIKRESWVQENKEFDLERKNISSSNFLVNVFGAYKKRFWEKKQYR